jgi:hypothetical protein
MMSIGLPRDQVGGSTASSLRRSASLSGGRSTPASAAASAAMTPAPPPLVISVRPRCVLPRKWASVSAAMKRSCSVSTRSMPGATDRSFEDHVGAGERARVRRRGLQSIAGPAGLDDHHRLVSSRGASRRHELPRRLDRFDVEQDRARVRVAGEMVEQITEVDVGALAERDHVRKADAPRMCPVEDRGHQRSGLRDKGHVAGQGVDVGEAGIQADPRRQQAQAVGAEHAEQVRPCRIQCGLLLHRAQASGHDDGGTRAEPAQIADQVRDGCRRRADHRQVRHLREVGDAPGQVDAVQGRVLGIDAEDGAGEGPGTQVAPHGGADAAGPAGCTDDDDRPRLEKPVEMADAHGGRILGRDRDLEHAVA